MKTLVSIPEELVVKVIEHKKNYYPDLTIPKILVRLYVEDIKRKEADKK